MKNEDQPTHPTPHNKTQNSVHTVATPQQGTAATIKPFVSSLPASSSSSSSSSSHTSSSSSSLLIGEDELSYEGLGEMQAIATLPIDPHTYPSSIREQYKRSASSTVLTPTSPAASSVAPATSAVAEKPPVHVVHEMLAGSASAVVSRVCIAPLDVLKIRFQIQEQASSLHRQYTSVPQAFKMIYQQEGLLAFWKGNAAAELMVIPYGAVSFLAYSTCKSWFPVSLKETHSSYHHLSSLTAGSFAGFCATICTYPLDLLRTRFAAQQKHKVYTSLKHAAQHIFEREGFGGFYVGMVPTLMGIVPLMALQFGSYEGLRQAIKNARGRAKDIDPGNVQLTFAEQSACGFSAGVISKFLTMPLDVIKKRFQVSGFEMVTNLATSPTAASASSPSPFAAASTPSSTSHSSHNQQHQHHHHFVPAASSFAAHPHASHHANHADHPNHSSVLSHHHPNVTESAPAGKISPLSASMQHPSTHLSSSVNPSASPSTTTPPATNGNHSHRSTPASLSNENLPKVPARRRRRHDQPVAGRRPFTGVFDCARGIYAHEGFHGLFKGSIPSILKAGPNSAIIYLVYEYTIRWLNNDTSKDIVDTTLKYKE